MFSNILNYGKTKHEVAFSASSSGTCTRLLYEFDSPKNMSIKCEGITKSFGDNKVLSGVDLSLKDGEIFGLIGQSGCGKSTFLKIILGILSPDSGRIVYKDQDITHDPLKIRRIIGYTTQENSFYEKLTIFENMKYYANLYNLKYPKIEMHIHKILKSVGLLGSKNTLAQSISGGMKRRLDFAISILHDPELLVLDEPTTGLDPLLVQQFWDVVVKNKPDHRTIIVSSHIFSELEKNCDRVGVVNNGKIVKIIIVKKNTKLYPIFQKLVGT